MQSESSPQIELNSESSNLSQETTSDCSSYGEKIFSHPIKTQAQEIPHSDDNHFNELSISNFQFEFEESFLPHSGSPNSEFCQKLLTSPQPKTQSSSPDLNHPEAQLDDEIDLKELLKLLDDHNEQDKPQSFENQHPQKGNEKNLPLKHVNVQNQTQKITNQPKNKDHFKRIKNEVYHHNQKNPFQGLNSQKEIPTDPKQFVHKPNIYCPPKWIPSQSYQNMEPIQKPYLQKPMVKPIQNPMNTYMNEFASQNFVFRNVLISIKLCSFLSLRKNVLLVPFSSSNLDDKISRQIAKKLKYNIREILYIQASKNHQKQVQDGYVFSVKAKGLEKNYRGIYFLKSPPLNQHQSMKYYSVGTLERSIKNVFGLINDHMEQDIIFPDFEWGSLNQNEIGETLIWSIFREISENKKRYRCQSLKEVIISVSSCQNFQIYSKWLGSYVQKLRS